MATENNRQGEGGSGSAENKGQSREDQKAQNTVVGEQERSDIAEQAGLKPGEVADLQDLGGPSGRDDASGGSGDDMNNTSSNQGTERF